MEKIRIAYAEDYLMVRRGIISLLSTVSDFEVVAEASDGKELLGEIEKLKKLEKLPHVCLLDIQMAGMDGYATLVALKSDYPDIEVLALSQLDEDFVIIKMLTAGASGYLHKDADPSELEEAIRIVLEGRYYQNEMVTGRIVSLVRKNDDSDRLVLSDVELEFLKYACSDLIYNAIASKMGVSKRTVEGYRERLFERLGIKSRTALALYALKLGITPYDDKSQEADKHGPKH